jgi:hypothetical protein
MQRMFKMFVSQEDALPWSPVSVYPPFVNVQTICPHMNFKCAKNVKLQAAFSLTYLLSVRAEADAILSGTCVLLKTVVVCIANYRLYQTDCSRVHVSCHVADVAFLKAAACEIQDQDVANRALQFKVCARFSFRLRSNSSWESDCRIHQGSRSISMFYCIFCSTSSKIFEV